MLARVEFSVELETHHFLEEVRRRGYFSLMNLKICFEISALQLFGSLCFVLGILWFGVCRANVIKRFIRDS